MASLSQKAQLLGTRSANAVGLDPITIMTVITTVLPAILQLFQSCRKASEPVNEQEWLKTKWNERRGAFDAPVLANAARKVREEYVDKRLTPKQSREIAHQMLYEGMTASKKEFASWVSEVV